MATVRMVDPSAYGPWLLKLFEANAQDATHPRAVLEEGAAQLWVVEDEGRLAGALLGRPMRSSDGQRRGDVDNLLVDAPYRRRGLGRSLMEAAEAHYRAQGLSGMELSLNAGNHVARSLYDSMGYVPVARYTRSRPDATGVERLQPRLRMRKPFGPVTTSAATASTRGHR
jgi:ribosomal protein S18 acetylase RimI-like enzyme